MAQKWSNMNLPGALHYVTGNVNHRIPIFKRTDCCEAFLEVFADLLRDWPCKVIAYVLMPDHLHFIVNPRDGNIIGFTQALKSLAAKSILEVANESRFKGKNKVRQVWQESFKALPLWSAWMIWQKINYIHSNPLKARLVDSARDYRWSSFRAFYESSEEPLPVNQEWWWPEDSEKLSKAMKELGWYIYEKRAKK